MIEAIEQMPAGTIGFRGHEKLTKSDYTETLIPVLRGAVESGDPVRLLFALDTDFSGLEASALWEDLKADLELGFRHASAWERIALVSDEGWVGRATSVFGWMSPGEIKVFPLAELEAAKVWVAGAL